MTRRGGIAVVGGVGGRVGSGRAQRHRRASPSGLPVVCALEAEFYTEGTQLDHLRTGRRRHRFIVQSLSWRPPTSREAIEERELLVIDGGQRFRPPPPTPSSLAHWREAGL
jgi:hypothetical protein